MPVLWVLTAMPFSNNRAEGRRSYRRFYWGRSGLPAAMPFSTNRADERRSPASLRRRRLLDHDKQGAVASADIQQQVVRVALRGRPEFIDRGDRYLVDRDDDVRGA